MAADRVADLNNLDVIHGSWWNTWNDIAAEDTISSFVLLGPPGRRLRIFQNPEFKGRHATITSSYAWITIVNDMRVWPPTTVPSDHAEQAGSPELHDRVSAMAFLASPRRHTLMLSSREGGTASAAPQGPTYDPGTAVTITATPSDGFSFSGWTVDGQGGGNANPLVLTMDSSHVVLATFAPTSPT